MNVAASFKTGDLSPQGYVYTGSCFSDPFNEKRIKAGKIKVLAMKDGDRAETVGYVRGMSPCKKIGDKIEFDIVLMPGYRWSDFALTGAAIGGKGIPKDGKMKNYKLNHVVIMRKVVANG